MVVFTYALAGLGHLRVTDALVDSLPKDVPYELLGSSGVVTGFHRFISVNPWAKMMSEAFQYGLLEDLFTKVYVWSLRHSTSDISKKIVEIIRKHPETDGVTVVATHFGLAHQIAQIKSEIKRKTGKDIVLAVQVTDDSSQHIWCVRGADLTMVPSKQTRIELESYAKSKGIQLNCEVSPYPVSPILASKSDKGGQARWEALAKESDKVINVMVPISGAAVGLIYLTNLLQEIDKLSKRFHFWIVAKRSKHTQAFLALMGALKWVQVVTGKSDREVVNLYEKVYQDNLIHLEITKPSEQSFKALIPPTMTGGSLLMFISPVGRQEYDNLRFLLRHRLIAPISDCGPESEVRHHLRGAILPDNPVEAARKVVKCLNKGAFEKMVKGFEYSSESLMTGEVDEKGTWLFWEKLRVLGWV